MKKNKQFDNWIKEVKNQSHSVKAPDHLWDRISSQLLIEETSKIKTLITTSFATICIILKPRKALTVIATAIFFFVFINILLNPKLITIDDAENLAREVDQKIFFEQKKYEKVIAELINEMSDSAIQSSNKKSTVYIEKLSALDMVISSCRSALERNPYSETVNACLISAFQNKIETLNLLINLKVRMS